MGDLEAFLRVADAGTISAAARLLGLTPSAVSKLVSRLERRLGVCLFNRTSRGLVLTAEGLAYHHESRRVIGELDRVERALAARCRAPQGRLVVSAPRAFAEHHLVPALPQFLAGHPAIAIDLLTSGEPVTGGVQAADLEIRVGRVHDDSLHARKLGTSRPYVVASPAYLRDNGAPFVPDDLAAHNCLRAHAQRAPGDHWTFVVDGRLWTGPVEGNVETDAPEALRELALAGLGIAWLPDFMVMRDVVEGRLVPLLEEHLTGHEEPVSALFLGHAQLPSRVRAFVEFVARRFERGSPWSPWGR